MEQLIWFITGCSSGFGDAFVHHILARGDLVIATARRLESIKHLEQPGVSTMRLDVTDDQKALQDTIDKAVLIHGRIDVLVNNAGFVSAGPWEEIEYDQWLAQFDTNVFGAIKVTRALLPHFRERRSGTMLFISSLVGWVGHPFVGPYAGSKFALEGVVESLSVEIAGFGIRTLIIEPGRFRTRLLSSGNLKISQSKSPTYAAVSARVAGSLAQEDGKQPGDVDKGVAVILDLVRKEGCAAGKEIPLRFPLGTDCYDDIKAKCEGTLKLLEDWKDVMNSTNVE